jgi:SAM-dependent methyltransferase
MKEMPADRLGKVSEEKFLTDQEYWDRVNAGGGAAEQPPGPGMSKGSGQWSSWLPRGLAQAGRRPYMETFLWERFLPRYLPADKGGSVLEMGAAPGNIVLEFVRHFPAYTPYGLEYTASGTAVTQKNFALAGHAPENALQADMFDVEATRHWDSKFDVVMSFGLIEHFSEPVLAVQQHIRMVRPGGLLVVSVPTLTGVHYAVTRMQRPDQLPLHNLAIMRKKQYARLFEDPRLELLHLDYEGGPNLMVAYGADLAGWRNTMQEVLKKGQFFMNLWANGIGRGAMPGAWMNSNLIAVARRVSA